MHNIEKIWYYGIAFSTLKNSHFCVYGNDEANAFFSKYRNIMVFKFFSKLKYITTHW